MTWTPKACGSVERRSRRIRMIRTWIPRNFSRTPKAPALQPGPDAMVKDLLPIHLFRRNARGAPVTGDARQAMTEPMKCQNCQSEHAYQDRDLWVCPECAHEW